ncbi:translation initiation factor IF-2-like [Schistocerca gregaria]|uniref:translation initiation factor IF-2-like n=1 Tax=Schistocerca gregaria TaxID=7010 RepID=UPI00211DC989|nr:translation initiation factor IF-2-like [Schistocerca gregaria]
MGLSEGWPSEAERLAARLQRWAAACSGYRKLRSCRISRGRQTMAQGADSDEDAAVSVGVGAGAGAGAGAATEATAAASRGLQAARPPRRSRPVGIKMFLTADEQAAIADAKSARPKHTVAHVTGNSSGAAAGVVLLAEQRVETREACSRAPNRVLLIQRPAAGQEAAAGGGGRGPRAPCPSIARPRPACPRRPPHHTEPLLPPSGLPREPPPQPAGEPPAGGQTAAAPARSASLEESAPAGGGHSCGVGPAPPTLQVEDAEEWCGVAPSRESSGSEAEEEEPVAAGKRHGGRIEVSLYSGGSQREDILSVSVEAEAEQPAMVRGCGLRKSAPPASVRRPPPPADRPTAGDPVVGRELGAGGRLLTRVDPRGRRELWWVSAAPPASPAPKRAASPTAARGGLSGELRGLLSFRRARRLAQQQQQQLARRRVVAAADARDRRQWPAVLLTFERGVSPEPGCGPPSPSPHALLAARKARLEVAAV